MPHAAPLNATNTKTCEGYQRNKRNLFDMSYAATILCIKHEKTQTSNFIIPMPNPVAFTGFQFPAYGSHG